MWRDKMNKIIELKEGNDKILCSSDFFDEVKKIKIDYTQENMLVVYVNTKNQVIDVDILFKGGLNACMVDIRTIYRNALLHNACSILIAHNHPSGDLNPSSEDRQIYIAIIKAGNTINIKCLGSIIFNEKDYYSMLKEVY
jgi:DNA repair protein RadC